MTAATRLLFTTLPPLLLFASAVAGFPELQKTEEAPDRTAAEDDIREAVLKKEMKEWTESGDKNEAEAKDSSDKSIAAHLNFKIFFVSISSRDPTDEFLRRFSDIPRTIKKKSDSEINKKSRLAVVDRKTRRFGIIFYTDKLYWLSDSRVEMEGGYHCDGLCAANVTYVVNRENGKWIVKSERMNWIS